MQLSALLLRQGYAMVLDCEKMEGIGGHRQAVDAAAFPFIFV